ncbi:MAG: hypothetical protein RBS78_06210 [Coriobacteriia bacterium]|nr:hypothetical protein [Coriobacteriia bacterium]
MDNTTQSTSDAAPESAEATTASSAAAAATPAPDTPGSGRRRNTATGVIVAIALVAITALGVAGWVYYKNTTTQRAAVEQLGQATALVKSADEVVLALDAIVQSEIASVTATQVAEVKDAVPSTVDELKEAIEIIDGCAADLPSGETAYSRALRDAAAARLGMLEEAGPILDGNGKMLAALGPATEAWTLMDQGTELSREAVVQYNKLTKESITQSTALTEQAIAKISEAKDLFSKAATAFPEADLGQFTKNSDQRIAALSISKQANEAHLAGKIAEANALGDKFNAAERDLAAKAAKLPASPKIPIAAAYDELVGEASTRYFQARAQAAEADARLRQIGGD